MSQQSKCTHLGCRSPRLSGSSTCTKHSTRLRRTRQSFYDRSSWSSIRLYQLSSQPLCARCLVLSQGKRSVIATAVDHVFPINHIEERYAPTVNNLFQSLCTPCHSFKTTQEMKEQYHYYDINAMKSIVYQNSDYLKTTNEDKK